MKEAIVIPEHFSDQALNARNETLDMHEMTEVYRLHPTGEERQLVSTDACSDFAGGNVKLLGWGR